ncbi:uncharacterized protein LOC142590460 isoform X4 [Dermacentor variabilis]|uniref:uncharacterized protein LOC142590460 isoform X4 n=1 Tax=Dermacentor variabilis TaxID=34621 RepID=UPI003F5B37B1
MLQSGALPFGKQRSSALLYQPKDAVTILAACAALHKITLKAGEPELEDSDDVLLDRKPCPTCVHHMISQRFELLLNISHRLLHEQGQQL